MANWDIDGKELVVTGLSVAAGAAGPSWDMARESAGDCEVEIRIASEPPCGVVVEDLVEMLQANDRLSPVERPCHPAEYRHRTWNVRILSKAKMAQPDGTGTRALRHL